MSRIATLVLLCVTAASSAVQAAPNSEAAPSAPAPTASAAPGALAAPNSEALPSEPAAPNSEALPSESAAIAPDASSVDSELFRERLAARRALNLERLRAYALAGQFPQNHVQPGLLNIFIDEAGHICAVANLIHLDGELDLVKKTAATDNYIVLASVTKGPLMDWMATSGFTQEEIGLIQAPYSHIEEPLYLEPVEQPKVTKLDIETRRVRTILLAVHKRLRKNSNKSLALVAQNLQTQSALPKAAPALSVHGPQRRFAQAP